MPKHTLVLAAFLSLCVLPDVSVQAQGTDFSGTWTLDRDASQIPEGRGGGRGDGGGGGGRGAFGGAGTVVITQSETELSMEQEARGQTRTVESTRTMPFGEMNVTLVFRKSS